MKNSSHRKLLFFYFLFSIGEDWGGLGRIRGGLGRIGEDWGGLGRIGED